MVEKKLMSVQTISKAFLKALLFQFISIVLLDAASHSKLQKMRHAPTHE